MRHSPGDESSGNARDIWKHIPVREIEQAARTVVGPDEPSGGRSQLDTELAHWAFLAEILQRQGILVTGKELAHLLHKVALDDRLLNHLRRGGASHDVQDP